LLGTPRIDLAQAEATARELALRRGRQPLIWLKTPNRRFLLNDDVLALGWRVVIMTSADLNRDLRDRSRSPIAALSASWAVDDEDIENLRWLQSRRKVLASLLAVRQEQHGKKVASLDVLRRGQSGAPGGVAKVA
jgi:hypothetical protein